MAEASNRHLTLVERCKIEARLSSGHSYRAIAAVLGVAAATVSREVQRNGLPGGGYDAKQADAMAVKRRHDASSRTTTPPNASHPNAPFNSNNSSSQHLHRCHHMPRTAISRTDVADRQSRYEKHA